MSKIYSNLNIKGQLTYNINPGVGYVLTTDSNGLASWTSSVSILPTASSDSVGGVIVGTGLTVSNLGVLSLSNASSSYTVGAGLTLSGTTFSLATASSNTIGGVIVGTGLTVSNLGVLSLSNTSSSYTAGVGLTLSGTTFSLITQNLKTLYVSPYGSDTNNGLTQFTPVLNIYTARDLAVSGDTITVLPGSYIFDNRNSAGCPYNGLVQTKVNLWKDGVTYNFLPGAKIYSYGKRSVHLGSTRILFSIKNF